MSRRPEKKSNDQFRRLPQLAGQAADDDPR
jgi:hypothetical protein